jgi:hypothetical protein
MRESVYTAKIRDLVKGLGVYPLKLSLRFEGGVADNWYSGRGGDLWVEWKWYATLPRVIDLTAGAKPKLSKLQQKWLTERHMEGRNVAVIVACAEGAVLFPGLQWVEPITREAFFAACRSRKDMAALIAAYCNDHNEDCHSAVTHTVQ